MKTVTRYQSEDGRLFTDEEECRKRDGLVAAARHIDAIIGPRVVDEGCEFANGGGFVQRDPERVFQAEQELRTAAFDHHGDDHPRTLDDSDSPLYAVWARLRAIDVKGREWGQTYFALHMNEGTQTEWRA